MVSGMLFWHRSNMEMILTRQLNVACSDPASPLKLVRIVSYLCSFLRVDKLKDLGYEIIQRMDDNVQEIGGSGIVPGLGFKVTSRIWHFQLEL